METLVETEVEETTSPIKPSEALRLGRLTRPIHGTDWYFGADGEACALGAMAEGLGFDIETSIGYALSFRYPAFDEQFGGCDEHPAYADRSLMQMIAHLNDDHEYSDDAMVGFLEGLGL